MADENVRDLLGLMLVPGVGPLISRALLERFGTAGKVLAASESALKGVNGLGPKLAARIARARVEWDLDAELALCESHGVQLIAADDSRYPAALRRIPDPPQLLFVRGDLTPEDALAVGIVGSRKCTSYGIRIAERLAAGLARAGLTVVSGLARGIDAAAHRGALAAGGRTIAVLANGLESIYPPEHDRLAADITRCGAVVSETPMRRPPMAECFPQRNRIISGLSLGVVVVEAAPRSGSLSTARHALEQDREVFAVPGPVDSLASRGCHRLIRDGAKLVETVEDILEELGAIARAVVAPSDPGPSAADPPQPTLKLSPSERVLLEQMSDQPIGFDAIAAAAGLPVNEVLATLPMLELRHLIKRLPGGRFVRSR